MTREQEQAVQRLRCALDMREAGVALMLQNLRRRFPNATDAQTEERLMQWLCARSDAEFGDCPGTARPWTR